MSEPQRGEIWRNKRTKRRALVLQVNEESFEIIYRSPNPNSRAKHMTKNRVNRTYIGRASFLEKFEPEATLSAESMGLKGR
jgi:hypothetical protein